MGCLSVGGGRLLWVYNAHATEHKNCICQFPDPDQSELQTAQVNMAYGQINQKSLGIHLYINCEFTIYYCIWQPLRNA